MQDKHDMHVKIHLGHIWVAFETLNPLVCCISVRIRIRIQKRMGDPGHTS